MGGAALLWQNHSTKEQALPSVMPTRAAPAVAAPPVALSPFVDLAVVVQPPGIADLAIEIAGARVAATEPHRALPRSERASSVRVSAPGYTPVEVDVTPDRDRSIMLTLSPIRSLPNPALVRPSGPPASAGPGPEAGPAGVIKRYPF